MMLESLVWVAELCEVDEMGNIVRKEGLINENSISAVHGKDTTCGLRDNQGGKATCALED
jgi:hypothetical protein